MVKAHVKRRVYSPTSTYSWNRSNVKFQDAVARPDYVGELLLQCDSKAQSSKRAGKNYTQTFAASFHLERFLGCAQSASHTISSVDDLPVISSVIPILARLTATRSNLRLEARTDSLCLGSVIIRLVKYDLGILQAVRSDRDRGPSSTFHKPQGCWIDMQNILQEFCRAR